MQFEPAEEVGNSPRPPADCPMEQPAAQPRSGACKPADLPITNAKMPNGKTMPLLKTMLTSACECNCNYCAFRAGRNFRRTTFSPDELSQTYMKIYNSGVARGVFLSSGVAGGGVRTRRTGCWIQRKYCVRNKSIRVTCICPPGQKTY